MERSSLQGKSLLVFGASSQIGHCLLPMLSAQASRVIAVSRSPQRSQDNNVQWLPGSLPEFPADDFDNVEAIACFAPLAAFAAWISNTPLPALKRVVATSSMSAESKRESPVAAEREVARRLREGEQALMRACESRSVAWTILRPTLIYGVGRDRSLTPLAQRAMHSRVFVLPSGSGLRQPVHAQDVALSACAALRAPQAGGHIVPIGGGERLTAQEMFARVRASLPVRTLPLPVPKPLIRASARMLPALRGPLTRLDLDLIADNSDADRLLGVHPRDFRPDRNSWGNLFPQ
ncbi:MAG TPA: NAD-dependent epimerase/dehydratase family protein [Rhodanobacteraceae bacterium]